MPPIDSFVPILTASQLLDLLRGVVREEVRTGVRDELASYVPSAPKAVALPDHPTRSQAKEALGVTFATMTNWSKATPDRPALLVPFKVGGRLRYRREDILALLNDPRRLRALQKKQAD